MNELKIALNKEGLYNIPDALMDMLLESMTEIPLQTNEVLIPYGKLDENVYIVKSGIVRQAYFDGLKEKTHAFGTQGTMIISFHSYYMRTPSFFQIEACCETMVLKISKSKFENFIKGSHDFAQWMLDLAYGQLWAYEMKLSVINGTAKERFIALISNRPDIIRMVSQKTIASYLGITPQYLSYLRRKLASGK